MEAIHRMLRSHLNRDLYEYGFADLRGLLAGPYERYSYGISIARQLDDAIIDGIEAGPTRDYFDHYHAINDELNRTVDVIVADLTALGIQAEAVPSTVRDEMLDQTFRATLTYPLSHKMAATRGSLGWIGKTDLLITSRFGARVRLATVLTTTPLETGQPIVDSQCGDCRVCVDHCPAQAATGQPWRAGLARESFFDAFKCRAYCRKICLERLDEHISICGKCVCVCPQGR
jgi:epoxyqueuosine reductase